MTKRRVMAAAVLVPVLAMGLAACGSSSGTGTSAGGQPSTSTSPLASQSPSVAASSTPPSATAPSGFTCPDAGSVSSAIGTTVTLAEDNGSSGVCDYQPTSTGTLVGISLTHNTTAQTASQLKSMASTLGGSIINEPSWGDGAFVANSSGNSSGMSGCTAWTPHYYLAINSPNPSISSSLCTSFVGLLPKPL